LSDNPGIPRCRECGRYARRGGLCAACAALTERPAAVKTIHCPGCGVELPEEDAAAQILHMQHEHPGLIAARLREAGLHPEAQPWEVLDERLRKAGLHRDAERMLTITFTEREWDVLTQIANDSETTREEVLRQALRLLQLHRTGMLDLGGGGCMGDDDG
jgi:hypothetical protein